MTKDFVFLTFFGLTCTMAYQAVEEERFTEQYFLSAFVVMQVNGAVLFFVSQNFLDLSYSSFSLQCLKSNYNLIKAIPFLLCLGCCHVCFWKRGEY